MRGAEASANTAQRCFSERSNGPVPSSRFGPARPSPGAEVKGGEAGTETARRRPFGAEHGKDPPLGRSEGACAGVLTR